MNTVKKLIREVSSARKAYLNQIKNISEIQHNISVLRYLADEQVLNKRTLFNFVNKFKLTEHETPPHRKAVFR